MPIHKTFKAPNGTTVSYHRVLRVEGRVPDLTVHVGSWGDRDAFLAGLPPAYLHYALLDATAMLGAFEGAALALEALSGGAVEDDAGTDLDAAKVRRWEAIKTERDRRDYAPIPYGDYAVDADASSRIDIMGAVMAMQVGGQASRLWRCSDNVMRELQLVDLLSIGMSIAARRQALIETSDSLYQQIRAAQDVEAVNGIDWPA